jgi:N-succinyldiaminopimelate aminotransferase
VTATGVSRMRPFGATIFSEMTALARQAGAVNLGQGFPDTDGPASMLDAAVRSIRSGGNQYAPGPGLPELRTAIAAQRARCYGLTYDPLTEVFVTVGATEGIAAALLGLVEPGREVVVFEPYYDSYAAVIALAGAVRRPVTLRPDPSSARFAFDPEQLRAAIGPQTAAILVNSPHNPTGTVFTDAELDSIAAVCVEHDLIAITDEVYEYLTYDGVAHRPLAALPGMAQRTVSISSAGKTFSCTGWKVGWVCAPAPLIAGVAAVKQFLTFTASGPFQHAVAEALDTEQDWVAGQRASLQARRDQLVEGLTALGLPVFSPQGTYFVQADIGGLGLGDGLSAARALPGRAGVAVVPTSVFYDDPQAGRDLVRFAFCKREEVIAEALARLGQAFPGGSA